MCRLATVPTGMSHEPEPPNSDLSARRDTSECYV
jgi:hypothetical protein